MAEPWSRRENLYLEPELEDRTRFFSEADRSLLDSVRCGILFVMAFWSGPSRQAFSAVKALLRRSDALPIIELVVVDIDGCTDLLMALPDFRGRVTGSGETAWIYQGRVVCSTFNPNREKLQSCMSALLAEIKAGEGTN